MSVSICWRPTKGEKSFHSGTSTSLAALGKVFGEPAVVGPEDVAKLRAMAIASNDKFFDEVADTIESVGQIEIVGRW